MEIEAVNLIAAFRRHLFTGVFEAKPDIYTVRSTNSECASTTKNYKFYATIDIFHQHGFAIKHHKFPIKFVHPNSWGQLLWHVCKFSSACISDSKYINKQMKAVRDSVHVGAFPRRLTPTVNANSET